MNTFVISCNYNQVEHLKDSMSSILKQKNENVKYIIVDNKSKNSEEIKKILFLNAADLTDYECLPNNIGKARAINNAVNAISDIKDDDLILLLDSDISLVTENFFDKVEEVWTAFKDKVSCLVCTQTGNSLCKREWCWRKSTSGIEYFVPSEGYGYGIAGGGMITSFRNWKTVGGFRINNGTNIYGNNDGPLMVDLFRKTGKPICVINDLKVFHPFDENNNDYQKWKDRQHQSIIRTGKTSDSNGFYDV